MCDGGKKGTPIMSPSRGKIIAENMLNDSTIIIEICPYDQESGQLMPDKPKKFKIKKCEIPCWFVIGCPDGDWIYYEEIEDEGKIKILGMYKNGYTTN